MERRAFTILLFLFVVVELPVIMALESVGHAPAWISWVFVGILLIFWAVALNLGFVQFNRRPRVIR